MPVIAHTEELCLFFAFSQGQKKSISIHGDVLELIHDDVLIFLTFFLIADGCGLDDDVREILQVLFSHVLDIFVIDRCDDVVYDKQASFIISHSCLVSDFFKALAIGFHQGDEGNGQAYERLFLQAVFRQDHIIERLLWDFLEGNVLLLQRFPDLLEDVKVVEVRTGGLYQEGMELLVNLPFPGDAVSVSCIGLLV